MINKWWILDGVDVNDAIAGTPLPCAIIVPDGCVPATLVRWEPITEAWALGLGHRGHPVPIGASITVRDETTGREIAFLWEGERHEAREVPYLGHPSSSWIKGGWPYSLGGDFLVVGAHVVDGDDFPRFWLQELQRIALDARLEVEVRGGGPAKRA